MVLHKIKDIQNFNILYTSNCPLFIIHFMTNETYWNCTKFILMKIHKYTISLKVISLIIILTIHVIIFKVMEVHDFMCVHIVLGSFYYEHTLVWLLFGKYFKNILGILFKKSLNKVFQKKINFFSCYYVNNLANKSFSKNFKSIYKSF